MTPVQQIEKIKDAFTQLRDGIDGLEAFLLQWADQATEADYPITAEPTTPQPENSPTEPTYNLEEARQVLATYAKAGHTTAVKDGLTQLGAAKLSDVAEDQLGQLISIVEGLIG